MFWRTIYQPQIKSTQIRGTSLSLPNAYHYPNSEHTKSHTHSMSTAYQSGSQIRFTAILSHAAMQKSSSSLTSFRLKVLFCSRCLFSPLLLLILLKKFEHCYRTLIYISKATRIAFPSSAWMCPFKKKTVKHSSSPYVCRVLNAWATHCEKNLKRTSLWIAQYTTNANISTI